MKRSIVAAVALGLVACGGGERVSTRSSVGPVTIVPLVGDPSCAGAASQLGILTPFLQVRSGRDPRGTFASSLAGYDFVATVTPDGSSFDWSATTGVDLVIARGPDGAAAYLYDPEATEGVGLAPPPPLVDGATALGRVTFCFDFELMVTRSADASLSRGASWQIAKGATADALTLAAGETFAVEYAVTVTATPADSGWAVEGVVTITNPAPEFIPFQESWTGDACLVSATEELGGGLSVPLDCGVTFPYVLPPGGTLGCTYAASLPDGTPRANVARVTTSYTCDVGSGAAPGTVDFGAARVDLLPSCVEVTDSLMGTLGSACAPGDTTFRYALPIGPYAACGDFSVSNTATWAYPEALPGGSATHALAVHVPCGGGCTYTQGYWKTHTPLGCEVAPTSPRCVAWPVSGLALGSVGYDVAQLVAILDTPVKGNGLVALAHQLIAAKLNVANGADASAVAAAVAAADALVAGRIVPPVGADRLASSATSALTANLASFNEGTIGPGHCGAQPPAAP